MLSHAVDGINKETHFYIAWQKGLRIFLSQNDTLNAYKYN